MDKVRKKFHGTTEGRGRTTKKGKIMITERYANLTCTCTKTFNPFIFS